MAKSSTKEKIKEADELVPVKVSTDMPERSYKKDGFLVTCTPRVWAKAQAAIHAVPRGMEVGMLCACDIDPKTGVAEVLDVYLPTQVISGGDIDHDPDQVAECDDEAYDNGLVINGSWHSHGTMGVFWSDDDEEVISRMIQSFKCGYVVSLVSNQHGDLLCRVDYRMDSPLGNTVKKCDELPFQLRVPKFEGTADEMRKLVEQRVSMRKSKKTNKFAAVSHRVKDYVRDSGDDEFDTEDMREDLETMYGTSEVDKMSDSQVEYHWNEVFGDDSMLPPEKLLERSDRMPDKETHGIAEIRRDLKSMGVEVRGVTDIELFEMWLDLCNEGMK